MIDIKKLLSAAHAAGLKPFEANIDSDEGVSVDTYNGKVETCSVENNVLLRVRGVSGGKSGSYSSDCAENEEIDRAVSAAAESARFGTDADPDSFISGGQYEYEQITPAEASVDTDTLIELAVTVDNYARALDRRITNVSVGVNGSKGSTRFVNDKGLDIGYDSAYTVISVSGDAKYGGETVSGHRFAFIDRSFDPKAFAAEFVDYTVSQFGGGTIESGKYKVVYAPESFGALLRSLKSAFSAFNAEKHMSLLEGKIGKNVFSELVTLEEKPIGSHPFAQAFDAEGVPCVNKTLIDRGVPTGFVYDTSAAKRAGVKSTGNARREGANIRPAVGYVELCAGFMSQDQLFRTVDDGLYVTALEGTTTGLDLQSGNYSLQAEGYVIENGVLTQPVSLITVAGNIMTDLKNVIAVGSDQKMMFGVSSPSVVVSEISVSGK